MNLLAFLVGARAILSWTNEVCPFVKYICKYIIHNLSENPKLMFYPPEQWISAQGNYLYSLLPYPRDIWKCLETFLVVTTEWELLLLLESHSVQDSLLSTKN